MVLRKKHEKTDIIQRVNVKLPHSAITATHFRQEHSHRGAKRVGHRASGVLQNARLQFKQALNGRKTSIQTVEDATNVQQLNDIVESIRALIIIRALSGLLRQDGAQMKDRDCLKLRAWTENRVLPENAERGQEKITPDSNALNSPLDLRLDVRQNVIRRWKRLKVASQRRGV
jgi:hypothetical protein